MKDSDMRDMFDAVIRAELIGSYDMADDWDDKDALRKVVCFYSTTKQYEEFKEARGL